MKQKRPKGVMNVVKHDDVAESGICQNPELASSLVKTFAPGICARICSTAGMGWRSLLTLLLSLVRSTQIRTFPFFIGTKEVTVYDYLMNYS